MVKLSDLRTREVINTLDGRKLGNIIDIDLDIERGRVLAVMLPGQVRGWSVFAKREEIVVPWEKIVRIGKDVILVELAGFSDIEGKYDNRYPNDDNRY